MNRINLYICVVLVSLAFKPVTSNAQVPREVPDRSVMPNGLSTPPGLRRIPDQFFRHDEVRDRVRSGEFVSLSVIRKKVQSSYPGRIVDVQLLVPKREGINFLYDVKVLTKSGKVLSVKVDAKSAKIVDVKG